jgi:hypothetical protein
MPDRKTERAEINRILSNRSSIQMLAPRRVGKTWLMHRMVEDLQAQGWATVFTDVEGVRTEHEFLREICRKIEDTSSMSQKVFGHLSHRLKRITTGDWEGNPIQAIGKIDPKEFSEALVASLNSQGDTFILVDEISVFVSVLLAKDERATLDFLYHLRELRQSFPRVRWLLTGSIGLDVVARRAGLHGALVDLEIFPLAPFTEVAARAYLDGICDTRQVRWPFALDDAAFAHLAQELGWLSPFYLNLIADRIRPTGGPAPNGRATACSGDVDTALNELLEPTFRGNFATWEEHLQKNFPPIESDRLHVILCILCENADGETFGTLQARLGTQTAESVRDLKNHLSALSNDGFLHELQGRWRFRSGLLRRYWLRYLHE